MREMEEIMKILSLSPCPQHKEQMSAEVGGGEYMSGPDGTMHNVDIGSVT